MMNAAQKRYYEKNKDVMNLRAKQYYEKNKEIIGQRARTRRKDNAAHFSLIERRCHLKTKYGLTLEGFDALLTAQGERCAICLRAKPSGNGWNVDHSHRTGKVRGVLCHHCNTALGLLQEDRLLLRRAEEYLTRTEG